LAPKAAPPTGIPASWPDGWAEYRSIRLDRLVAEANRYAAAPIVIDESAIGEREVSGRFQISKTGPFAERIATLFDLRVERRADAIHLSRR
jgi:transmembrane sensor